MKIYILYTGGTIGSIGTPLAPMDGKSFSAAFNSLVLPIITANDPDTTIHFDWFDPTLDSTNMQPSEWALMARKILEKYDNYDDFLILHGTDTMAWTSSALSFLLPGLSKSVTITGSQLPMFVKDRNNQFQLLFNTDATRNVLGAIGFFPMEVPEVCLYFADYLFRGNRVVKSNASDFVAFSSPNYHAIGHYASSPKLFSNYILPVPRSKSLSQLTNRTAAFSALDRIEHNFPKGAVLQLPTFPAYSDSTSSLLASMLQKLQDVSPKLHGIIFESYGIGNIPSFDSVQTTIGQMHDNGTILVDCTQVFAGGVNYNEYATGAWLKDKGVISGQDMTSIAAMAKLSILKASNCTTSQSDVEHMMSESMAGELTSYYSLSGYQNDYLVPGESLFSINGQYELANEEDGGIALYENGSSGALWSQGRGKPGRLVMQGDNHLVLYDAEGKVTYKRPNKDEQKEDNLTSYLKVGDDGSLKLYNLDTDEIWCTIYARPEHTSTISTTVKGKQGRRKAKKWGWGRLFRW